MFCAVLPATTGESPPAPPCGAICGNWADCGAFDAGESAPVALGGTKAPLPGTVDVLVFDPEPFEEPPGDPPFELLELFELLECEAEGFLVTVIERL